MIFKLCLFLMIARTLMFSKTFSIVFDVKNKLSSSLNIWLISFRISRTDPWEYTAQPFFVLAVGRDNSHTSRGFLFFHFLHSIRGKQLFCKDYLWRITQTDMLMPPQKSLCPRPLKRLPPLLGYLYSEFLSK